MSAMSGDWLLRVPSDEGPSLSADRFVLLVFYAFAYAVIRHRDWSSWLSAPDEGVPRGESWVFRPVRRVRFTLLGIGLVCGGLLLEAWFREPGERPHAALLFGYAAGILGALAAWPPSIVLTARGVLTSRWKIRSKTLPYHMITDCHEDEHGGILIVSCTGKNVRISSRQAGLEQMLFLLKKQMKKHRRA